ncbi:unnamed protein product, partial [Brachionus calyciflorus]
MKGSTSHASLANKCSIFRTAEEVDDILPSIRDFVQMTLVDFTNSMIDALGEDNSKNLNRFRIKLAQYVKSHLKLDSNLKILNRHKVKQMAKDVWYLLISIEEKKLQANHNNPDFNRLFDRLFDELNELKQKNDIILKRLDYLTSENADLKKLISQQFRFKNFNFYNQSEKLNSDCVEVENENLNEDKNTSTPRCQQNDNFKFKSPMPVDEVNFSRPTYAAIGRNINPKARYDIKRNTNKNKCIIGSNEKSEIKSASKLFHFYVGFCEKNTTEESLKNYINTFAGVERIVTLDTKDRNYSSFHVQVYSHHNDKMLNPNNWTKGVKIKRYFFATEKRQGFRYRKIDNVTRDETEISENIAACSNKNKENSTTGRGQPLRRGASNALKRGTGRIINKVSSNTSEMRQLAPVLGTPNQSNFRGYPFLKSPTKTPNKRPAQEDIQNLAKIANMETDETSDVLNT